MNLQTIKIIHRTLVVASGICTVSATILDSKIREVAAVETATKAIMEAAAKLKK